MNKVSELYLLESGLQRCTGHSYSAISRINPSVRKVTHVAPKIRGVPVRPWIILTPRLREALFRVNFEVPLGAGAKRGVAKGEGRWWPGALEHDFYTLGLRVARWMSVVV